MVGGLGEGKGAAGGGERWRRVGVTTPATPLL